MKKHEIKKYVEQAEKHETEEPRPLRKAIRPSEPFPISVLGNILGDAAEAIHKKIQAPQAICAQSVLAAATLAVQGHADIKLPIGQTRPLSGFFMSIAITGERKSSCDTEALKAVSEKEEDLRSKHKTDLTEWENKKKAWDREQALILKKSNDSMEQVTQKLSGLGPSPEPPLIPMLTCPEPTYEGLVRHLIIGHPSVGVFTDEGGQFIGGHGMNEDNRVKTAAAFCNLWDGKPIKRVRAGDGAITLPGRRVSAHIMAQPFVANIMLSNRMLEDQGLLSRFLFTAPESTIGTRFFKLVGTEATEALNKYNRTLLEILNAPLPIKQNTTNELEPKTLMLNKEAAEIWAGFADEVEKKMAAGGQWEQIRGFANKLPEHAARLAGVLAMVTDIRTETVGKEFLYSGIVLASYYAGEALKLHEQGYIDPDILLAERLLDWLHNGWTEELVSLPDIYQLGLNAISTKEAAKRIVHVLVDHGWLIPVEGGAIVKGKKRRDVWHIYKL